MANENLKFFLAKSEDEINEMFDSSFFNDIVKGYVLKMQNENVSIEYLLDTVSAKEAREYYRTH